MRRRLVAAAVLAAVVTACSGSAALPPPVQVTAVVPPTTVAPPAPTPCTTEEAALDATRSYPPLADLPQPNAMPGGSTMRTIQDRGRLIVGVSADTLLFGARNPFTTKIEGFDIDILKEVALAIFGGTYDKVDDHLEYRVITYAQRLPALEAGPANGGVDIVAHTMTINCNRWLRIAFSAKYFDAGQKVLVKADSGYASIDDLVRAQARVCAPEGSTNIELLRDNPDKYGALKVIAKPDVTDCLVALQQGEADALTGDDTVLAGLKAQDPNTEVVGDKFTDEPYGLGIGKDNVDFVQFVNAVLEQVKGSGRWKAIFDHWLTGILPPAEPPAPNYDRPLP